MSHPHGRFAAPSQASIDIERQRRDREAKRHEWRGHRRGRDESFIYAQISNYPPSAEMDYVQIVARDRRGAAHAVAVPLRVRALQFGNTDNIIAVTAAEKHVLEFADGGGVIDYTEAS